ncbi:MAG TPA: hypothetical protein VIR03_00855 [Candidatus Saccharimonadales bacterium]
MSEHTFANYSPVEHGLDGIYRIGATEEHPDGVAHEMATAFGYNLDVPDDGFVDAIGSANELERNIAAVQEALGTDDDAVTLTRGWAARSGLLVPVARTFATAEAIGQGSISRAVVTGGVRNWMVRRAERLEELAQEHEVKGVLLAAGSRPMKTSEGPDAEEGMTEATYMRDVIAPRLGKLGVPTDVLCIDSGKGSDVMLATALALRDRVDLEQDRIAVVSNAGAWVQNAGQLRRGIQSVTAGRFDASGEQLVVVSDRFELGNGTEPTTTHQNPLSATGQIARNLREFAMHAA